MILRILASAIIAVVVSVVAFAIVTAAQPEWAEIYAPFMCEDWQTLETRTSQTANELNISYVCTGDGIEEVTGRVFLFAFVTFFVPIFPIVWLLSYITAAENRRERRKKAEASTTDLSDFSERFMGGTQAVNVTSMHARSDTGAVTETLALLQEALSDGVITPDELAHIERQVQGQGGTVVSTGASGLSGRLRDLQSAYSQGLITKDEYDQKRREILREF